MFLCYKLPVMSHTPTPHPLLRETSHVTLLLSNSPLKVAWFGCPVVTAKATFTATGTYDHIWQCLGYWQHPVTSLDPKFWCYIFRRFGSLRGHSWLSLATVIAVRIHHHNFFVIEVSLQAELPNYLIACCFICHHSSLYQLLPLSPINKLQ
jgi:hypothetical protein